MKAQTGDPVTRRSAMADVPSSTPSNNNYLIKPSAGLYGGVLAQLRRLIFEGELKPESRIVERVLCERLKVSRTPLREALKVLAAEGLVELLPHCGARVARFQEMDIRNAMEVMGAIEGLAGELAATRASEDVIAEIQALHYQMRAHYLRHELPEYFRLNQAIHRRIVEAAGNDLLTAHYDSLSIRVARARYLANRLDEERWAAAMKEHEAMLDCLVRHAGAELQDLLKRHIINKLSSLLEHFPGAGPVAAPRATKTLGPRLQGQGAKAPKRSA
jgi:DNA-binding GntR family transcriptional regulator